MITNVNNGSPVFVPNASIPHLTYEVVDGAESITDYKEKFRKYLTGIININTHTLSNIEVTRIKYRSIKADHYKDGTLAIGTKFAYAGQTADSVIVTVKRKSGVDLDFKELLDKILGAVGIPEELTGGITTVVKKLSLNTNDSLAARILIVNPNVYFKARFVEFMEGNPPILTARGKTWDDYWIHFYNNSTNVVNEYTILDASRPQMQRETKRNYVQFWGLNDDKSRRYFFKTTKDGDKLKLLFMRAITGQNDTAILEIPSTKHDGKVTFEQEYIKVDEFWHSGKTKFVYVACFAEQLDNNRIRLHNFDEIVNDKGRIMTYIKYPEVKFKYLSKND
ncbi:hypothetical protein CK934_11570 [Chitinophaga sp. MD30]|nr:hypothetical protein CK934_11570 [Chitinophaga sp. MD30]